MKTRRFDLRAAPGAPSVESWFLSFCYLLRFSPGTQLQGHSVQVGGLCSFHISEQRLNAYV